MPLANQAAPNESLAESVALVTGGSRGIGMAIARRLAALGAHVAIAARDSTRLRQATAELSAAGAHVMGVQADVTREGDVQAMVSRVTQELGPIDVLVNNAGTGIFGPFQDRSEADWDAVLNTNLKAVFLVSRAVAPDMIRRKRGHIVNIGSLAGKSAFVNGAIYCASKWGLMGLSNCMAEELRAHGVRVSVVSPGSVATEFSSHAGRDPDKLLQPDDVARAVETIVNAAPQAFISEILLRPTQKS